MKRWRSILCGALAAVTLIVPAAAGDATYLPPAAAQAYLDLLEEPARMGICMTSQEVGVSSGFYWGLVAAELIDMDGDDSPELYYCYRGGNRSDGFQQYLYTWYNGALKKLPLPVHCTNSGGEGYILYDGKKSCFLQIDGDALSPGGQDMTYYTLRNGRLVSFAYNMRMDDNWQTRYTSGGKTVSEEWVEQQVADCTAGCTQRVRNFLYSANTTNPLEKEVSATISKLRGVLRPTVRPSSQNMTLDGEPVQLGAYMIAGNNYFKLRDLAALLNGTDAQFEVAWNGERQRIDLRTGAAYTSVGGELQALPAGSKVASVTTASVYLNGRRLSLTAFEIDGNNYFKLRDLGEALDFGVDWDESTRTVLLNT